MKVRYFEETDTLQVAAQRFAARAGEAREGSASPAVPFPPTSERNAGGVSSRILEGPKGPRISREDTPALSIPLGRGD